MGFITCLMMCCTQVLHPTPWTKVDQNNLDHARKRCRVIYPKSPCLTKFLKVEDLLYRATCGKNNN